MYPWANDKKNIRLYKRRASGADEAIHSNRDSAIDLVRNSALYLEIMLSWFPCHSFDYNLNNIIATLSFHFFDKKIIKKQMSSKFGLLF